MTSIQQRAELQRRIWQIANDVRGAVDGWDFKQYVLGTLFYRFISENFAAYIKGGDDSVEYAGLSDLAKIFSAIESSAMGYPSERDIRGLFADFDTTSNRLGNTVKDKNTRLAAVLKGVAELDFGDFDASGLFKKETNNNVLLDEHIKEIMAVFDSKANVDHFSQSVSFEKVVANDYNLSVSSYVAAKDNREAVDITQLNAQLKTTVVKIDKLRKDIDAIIAEIEGGEV